MLEHLCVRICREDDLLLNDPGNTGTTDGGTRDDA